MVVLPLSLDLLPKDLWHWIVVEDIRFKLVCTLSYFYVFIHSVLKSKMVYAALYWWQSSMFLESSNTCLFGHVISDDAMISRTKVSYLQGFAPIHHQHYVGK